MILVSACLAGVNCKYNGKNNLQEKIKRLVEDGHGVLVCPEVMGGMEIPRIPSEIKDGRVINQVGDDVTDMFEIGALRALQVCKDQRCELAILKKNSPSCSPCGVYDGSFSSKLVDGMGVFAKKLQKEGIVVLSEEDIQGMSDDAFFELINRYGESE